MSTACLTFSGRAQYSLSLYGLWFWSSLTVLENSYVSSCSIISLVSLIGMDGLYSENEDWCFYDSSACSACKYMVLFFFIFLLNCLICSIFWTLPIWFRDWTVFFYFCFSIWISSISALFLSICIYSCSVRSSCPSKNLVKFFVSSVNFRTGLFFFSFDDTYLFLSFFFEGDAF